MSVDLDEIDFRILKILQENARTYVTNIAEELDLSDTAVHARIDNLESSGVIKKYTILIDEKKIGKPIRNFLFIRTKSDKIEEVCKRLVEIDEVYAIHEILEQYNVFVKLRAPSTERIRNVLTQKILMIPDILASEVITIYKTWKQDRGVRIE